jgi:hypothetical protein
MDDTPYKLPRSYEHSKCPADYVERLYAPVYGRCQNLTADNWLSNVELREKLLKVHLIYVGTIQNKSQLLP